MTANLNEYAKQVQRFLRDTKQELLNMNNLVTYINRARREIALQAQCIRRLTPITGAVVTASVVSAGSGYTNSPTITITTPDFPSGQGPFPNGSQATAAAMVQAGTVAAVDITYGGAGYWEPTATITDSTGTGASITLNLSTINQLTQGAEVYNFADVDLSPFPGVESIYMVQSVSVLFSGFRYSLACYDFSTYQALIRQWAQQWQYVPAVCAQYGQGVDGSFYMYPIPSQAYQMEWDCLCLPSDLTTNLSEEALPGPWTDVVPYFASHLAYLELQNFNASKYYFDLYEKMLLRYSRAARPGRAVSKYGRYAGGM
jgi:hypothetical protein